MPAIFTLTFNPCIDVSTSVDTFRPEIKLRCSEPLIHPGGGGINVARAIHKLGGHANAVFPCGGYNGQKLKSLLEQENIGFIALTIEGNTRENMIVTETSTGNQYKLNMPGPHLDPNAYHRLLSAIDNQPVLDFLVVSGSLAPDAPAELFVEIEKIARRKRSMLIIDTSGDALKHAVDAKPDLLKCSVHELASLHGNKPLSSIVDIENAARRLCDAGIHALVISMGDRGAVWLSHRQSGRIQAPPVKAVNSVGAGDSMVAGIVLKLSLGRQLPEAVEYGIACGSAATLNPGTTLCELKDVDSILCQMKAQTETNEKYTCYRGRI